MMKTKKYSLNKIEPLIIDKYNFHLAHFFIFWRAYVTFNFQWSTNNNSNKSSSKKKKKSEIRWKKIGVYLTTFWLLLKIDGYFNSRRKWWGTSGETFTEERVGITIVASISSVCNPQKWQRFNDSVIDDNLLFFFFFWLLLFKIYHPFLNCPPFILVFFPILLPLLFLQIFHRIYSSNTL